MKERVNELLAFVIADYSKTQEIELERLIRVLYWIKYGDAIQVNCNNGRVDVKLDNNENNEGQNKK